jgi:uncharacterized protein
LNQIALIFHSPCHVHFGLSLPLKPLFYRTRQYVPIKRTLQKTKRRTTNRGLKMIWDNVNTNGNDEASMSSNAESCLAMGMKYCIGHGVAQNNIIAHKWFNIAAIKGSDKAKSYRLELSQEMSATEIAEAQRQARQFLTLH